ncbi:hypothetical protein GGH94_000221 [Coemansia aciculifera]|uniref:Uncharacterized protein n=1 Tax=Coemansia aciculifera TaxID=417176 RepID=A0A9W8M8R4_9FUNG|nr:hypothetical protein GGH94_000221 [Coemansia aciculifera]
MHTLSVFQLLPPHIVHKIIKHVLGSTRVFKCPTGVNGPSTLSKLYDYVNIQVLSMSRMDLSIWDAIALIKSLPLLSDLHTRYLTLGERPRGIKENELLDYVRTTYAPMGKRFRCWKAAGSSNHGELATCMLLLALVCPNFDYAAVSSYRDPFMEAMKEKIGEPGFRQDAPRLRRLLFNRWQG